MPNLKIEGVPPYDGEYPLDIDGLTNRELHSIKETCGVRAGEIRDALRAGDVGLFVAVTALILKRAGFLDVNLDVLWDAPEECFKVVETEEDRAAEDAERPPVSPTPGGSESEPGVED